MDDKVCPACGAPLDEFFPEVVYRRVIDEDKVRQAVKNNACALARDIETSSVTLAKLKKRSDS
jgi:hypothetical protein